MCNVLGLASLCFGLPHQTKEFPMRLATSIELPAAGTRPQDLPRIANRFELTGPGGTSTGAIDARISTERGTQISGTLDDASAAAFRVSSATGDQAQAIFQTGQGNFLIQPLVQLVSEYSSTPGGRIAAHPLRIQRLLPWLDTPRVSGPISDALAGVVLGDRFTRV